MTDSRLYCAIRLTPGSDLRKSIENWCIEQKIEAGVVLTMVGSLDVASIRMAGKSEPGILQGPFEIVSNTGTVSCEGVHIHLGIADSEGKIIGGHLSHGSKVNTTVEVVVLNLSREWRFERTVCPQSGEKELKLVPKE